MSDSKKPSENGRSQPERLAAEAGAPGAGKNDNGVASAKARSSETSGSGRAAGSGSDWKDSAADAVGAARERVSQTADDLRGRASDAYDDVSAWAGDRYEEGRRRASRLADRGYRRMHEGRTATEVFVSDNPLLVGVVGLAAGLMLGALLPRTEREDEALGPWADEARDQGLRYAREATRQGRAFVERALDPDNLDAAVSGSEGGQSDDKADRTAHRL